MFALARLAGTNPSPTRLNALGRRPVHRVHLPRWARRRPQTPIAHDTRSDQAAESVQHE